MNRIRPRPPLTLRRPAAPPGFSLVEILVAASLLLVILLGLLPLLHRARLVVEGGGRAARLALHASAGLERRLAAGFRRPPDGSPLQEFFSRSRREWSQQPPAPPDLALWTRATRVRRYPPPALDDGRLDPGEALAGGDVVPGPLLWEVEVQVGGGAAALGGGRGGATLRLLRAF